jgi:hypothetical protein
MGLQAGHAHYLSQGQAPSKKTIEAAICTDVSANASFICYGLLRRHAMDCLDAISHSDTGHQV